MCDERGRAARRAQKETIAPQRCAGGEQKGSVRGRRLSEITIKRPPLEPQQDDVCRSAVAPAAPGHSAPAAAACMGEIRVQKAQLRTTTATATPPGGVPVVLVVLGGAGTQTGTGLRPDCFVPQHGGGWAGRGRGEPCLWSRDPTRGHSGTVRKWGWAHRGAGGGGDGLWAVGGSGGGQDQGVQELG